MAKSQIETNLLANFWLKECLAILMGTVKIETSYSTVRLKNIDFKK